MGKVLLYCIGYALLNVSGAAIIKWNLKGKELSNLNQWIGFLAQFQIVLAFAFIFGSALIIFKALSSGNFSLIIPVSVGVNFIFTVLIGHYLFKDPINHVSLIGFTLIISGIMLLSLNTVAYAK